MKLISKEDGGWYGWMVVLASHFIQVLIIGCEIGMGVFLVEFMEYFGEGAGKTAIIQSLQAGMMSCPAPLISSLNNKFGTRPLVIIGGVLSSGGLILSSFANSINVLLVSYSIIVGIGFGFAYGPSIVIVGQYFHKQHALTNGIVYAGVGVGIMTLPPLYQILIDTYGWRGAMLVMAGINMNICVCGMLMRPPPKYDPEPKNVKSGNVTKYQLVELCENGRLPAEGMESDYKQCRDEPQSSEYHMVTRDIKYVTTIISELLGLHLFKNSWFRTLCFTAFLIGVGDLISMVHYVSKVVSVGIDKLQAAFLLTIMGLSTIVVRITHGRFVDLRHFTPMFIAACAWFTAGVSVIFIVIANSNYFVYALIAALYGVCNGIGLPLHGAVCIKETVGTHDLSSAFGWYLVGNGLGNGIGPPLAGFIYDSTSNYNLSFVLAGCTLMGAALLMFMQIASKRCQSRKRTKKAKNKHGSHGDETKIEHKHKYKHKNYGTKV